MEISIKGDPKEIAALVLAVQERQCQDVGKIELSVDGHTISRADLEDNYDSDSK